MNALNVDTGKLSFHIRSLAPFLEQTSSGKYKLSRAGDSACRVIRDIESWAEVADVERKETQLLLASFKKRTYAFLADFARGKHVLGCPALHLFVEYGCRRVFSSSCAASHVVTPPIYMLR